MNRIALPAAIALLGPTLALPNTAAAGTAAELRATIDQILVKMHQQIYTECGRTKRQDGTAAVRQCRNMAGSLLGSLQSDVKSMPARSLQGAANTIADCIDRNAHYIDGGLTGSQGSTMFLAGWSSCVTGR